MTKCNTRKNAANTETLTQNVIETAPVETSTALAVIAETVLDEIDALDMTETEKAELRDHLAEQEALGDDPVIQTATEILSEADIAGFVAELEPEPMLLEASIEIDHDAVDAEIISDDEAEEAVHILQATEVQAPEATDTPAEEQPPEPTFSDLIQAIDEEAADAMVHRINNAVTDRERFETLKSDTTGKTNIHSTLTKVRSSLVTKRAAKVFIACNVDPSFINREIHGGSKYNVYALGKIADIVRGLTGDKVTNAINLACMRSLFRFRAAGVAFTLDMAKAACSKNIRVESAIAHHLVRHTVSPSTAPTQASSTMQALETLGVVEETGNKKNPTFSVTEHPVVKFLDEALKAA